jgi:diguanylate cyclase (GGDEF)-like protein
VRQGRKAATFEVLRDLARLCASGLPLDDLAAALAERTCTLLEADGALVVLEVPALSASAGLSRAEAARLLERTARGGDRPAPGEGPGRPAAAGGFGSLVVAPIVSAGQRAGRVAAVSRRRGAFGPEHEEVLAFLAHSLIGDLEAARLYRLATVDPETRAGTRALLAERLPDEIGRARRGGGGLALVRFGVREFARLQAAQGAMRAGHALAEVVRRVAATLRLIDCLVRLGDDAFLCLLPGATLVGAQAAAARLSAAVAAHPIDVGAGVEVRLTVIAGAAVFVPTMDESELLAAADQAFEAVWSSASGSSPSSSAS